MVVVLLLPLVIVCIFKACSADLMSCPEGKKTCVNDGYVNPFPVFIETQIHLRTIGEVNEEKNSISIQIDLLSLWKDPGLIISNKSEM